MDFRSRQVRLQHAMDEARVDALLVTHLTDVRYLCGFTGSSGALVVLRKHRGITARLFTDGRYATQTGLEVKDASVRIVKGSALAEAVVFVANSQAGRCGFDAGVTTVQDLSRMRETTRGAKVKAKRALTFFKPVEALVGTLRERKDEAELEKLRQAALLGSELYEGLLGWIETGMREIDVAAELEYRARKAGAEAMSFETIVASGVRSSMPHARATPAALEPGSLLTIDFGIVLDGYCSDMTRTVFLGGSGKPQRAKFVDEQRRVFEAVREAQEAAVATVREGVTTGEVDEAARSVLRTAGLADFFSHSTGHGLGLQIHEGPRIAAGQTLPLKEGMVITIEPGAYLPGSFGVRIEDTVAVTKAGCEIFTPAHRGWIEL